jgi:hypothetical protein
MSTAGEHKRLAATDHRVVEPVDPPDLINDLTNVAIWRHILGDRPECLAWLDHDRALTDRLRPFRRSATRPAHEEASHGKGDHCHESDKDELAPSGQMRAFASHHDCGRRHRGPTSVVGGRGSISSLEARVSGPPTTRGARMGVRRARLSGGPVNRPALRAARRRCRSRPTSD